MDNPDMPKFVRPPQPVTGIKPGFFNESTAARRQDKSMLVNDVYDSICGLRAPRERMDDGSNATLRMFSTGWLLKADRAGVMPQVAYEYSIYSALHECGLAGDVAPKCLLEEGVFGYPDSFVIERVNDCATLFEYGLGVKLGIVPESMWVELCVKTGEALQRFHQAGFVHMDLHSLNVVVSLEEGQLKPYLIDFGLSSYDEIEYPYMLTDWSLMEPSSDVDALASSLGDINSPAIMAGIAAFERAASM